jgi:tRNA-dihydrouridine synthase
VPPLRHEWAWALKRDFPHLAISLNGGIHTAHEAAEAIALDAAGLGPGAIEGVMIGRAAYNDPWGCLGDADRAVFGADVAAGGTGEASTSGQAAAAAPAPGARTRRQVLERYCEYADTMQARCGGAAWEWVGLLGWSGGLWQAARVVRLAVHAVHAVAERASWVTPTPPPAGLLQAAGASETPGHARA